MKKYKEGLLTRWLPHLKCIWLNSVRGWLRAFKSTYINACRVNSDTQNEIGFQWFETGSQHTPKF